MNTDQWIAVPEAFPAGCLFVASFSGDEYVEYPDGRVYKVTDDGMWLRPCRALPDRGAPMSEEGFIGSCAASRQWAARRV